jgi:hypothetical protein
MDVATMRKAFPGLPAERVAELNAGLNTAMRQSWLHDGKPRSDVLRPGGRRIH